MIIFFNDLLFYVMNQINLITFIELKSLNDINLMTLT